jgi:hypothetical protein
MCQAKLFRKEERSKTRAKRRIDVLKEVAKGVQAEPYFRDHSRHQSYPVKDYAQDERRIASIRYEPTTSKNDWRRASHKVICRLWYLSNVKGKISKNYSFIFNIDTNTDEEFKTLLRNSLMEAYALAKDKEAYVQAEMQNKY